MKLERLRWLLLPVAAVGALVMLFKGVTPGRLAATASCALAWYGLSRRKVRSLDRDLFNGGRLGRRSDD
ncbi:MAG: hypothetical protein Q8T11_13995 [Elusimicrobiota bacterium]|nr:hypothetical protein [Elusimicrobiota bacterium]